MALFRTARYPKASPCRVIPTDRTLGSRSNKISAADSTASSACPKGTPMAHPPCLFPRRDGQEGRISLISLVGRTEEVSLRKMLEAREADGSTLQRHGYLETASHDDG